METEQGGCVRLGDVLRVERRVMGESGVETRTDNGQYRGVQLVGSVEHLVLEDPEKKEMRLLPLAAISEIVLIETTPRAPTPPDAPAPEARTLPWDPSFA